MARPKLEIKRTPQERVRRILKAEGLTQCEFSKKIGVSQQTISKIINGRINVSELFAQRINKSFPKYNVSWILGFDGTKGDGNVKIDEVTIGVKAELTVDERTATACLSLVEIYCNQNGVNLVGERQDDGTVTFYFESKGAI